MLENFYDTKFEPGAMLNSNQRNICELTFPSDKTSRKQPEERESFCKDVGRSTGSGGMKSCRPIS